MKTLPLLLLVLAACSPAEPKPPMLQEQQRVEVRAKVESIDLAERRVTLRGPKGELLEVRCDESVRNLPQLKVGDQVRAVYYQSLAVNVLKPGQEAPGSVASVGRAKEGEKPGGVATVQKTVTATIEAIDTAAPSITLKGPAGNVFMVEVREPKMLEGVHAGDRVVLIYREALAITVEAGP